MSCKEHLVGSNKLYGIMQSVADPGFVKREGRESRCRARPEKVAQRGGDSNTFWASFTLWGIGVPSACQTDLQGEKKKEEKRGKKGGGGTRPIRPPPPPWIRH